MSWLPSDSLISATDKPGYPNSHKNPKQTQSALGTEDEHFEDFPVSNLLLSWIQARKIFAD